ncbi:uncharacterized protein Z520_11744 [Fonsecaea multimorphosa CBS 102226]|uniref:DUF7924 domain-containing protein n=1 Tax=Fonsecaea multimorphosa CBS 102226 TaxID=1442371 RepID=A0A0D2K8B9_9EURO|nr:uncharacterized protein Z520_11744 [Fonsecaea multimorphosa CBS 102226]KIX92568.1 hypothetical protein Z520_11744 [Fonsecaea multimorphosa CBS 102226]OAL17832.1 hypothetical protein AYO22_11259 [Fonsecaea multimorphosa]
MSSFSESHAPKAAAGLDTLESPIMPARLESLHQPQPHRPPALATILHFPKPSQTSKVEDWLASLDEGRRQHSKSDSHLTRICRFFQPTRILSELEMPKKPTSPDPSLDPSPETNPETRASCSLVGAPRYRERNLDHNNIQLRSMREKLPEHVQGLVDDMFKERQSPEPEAEDIRKDTNLTNLSDVTGTESLVTKYFKKNIFEDPTDSRRLEGLGMTEEPLPIHREHIPSSNDSEINLPVSQPKPDILYGYFWNDFTSGQQRQFKNMNDIEYTANSQGLIYPFFVIEIKGDGLGPTAGSLWVATNQCLGGAATCINMAEKLNRYIEQLSMSSTVSPVDTTVFSIAMNGSEARLLVSWKEDDGSGRIYYTQQIQGLLVYRPQDYLLLRLFVRNVLEWGRDRRRAQIGAVLDAAQEGKKRKLDAMSQDAIEGDSKRSRHDRRVESMGQSVQESRVVCTRR